jgi:hypothetical protein
MGVKSQDFSFGKLKLCVNLSNVRWTTYLTLLNRKRLRPRHLKRFRYDSISVVEGERVPFSRPITSKTTTSHLEAF